MERLLGHMVTRIMHSFGGNVLVYGRSMMKPLMMKPFTEVLEDLDWKQKAISCSSHNGDTEYALQLLSPYLQNQNGG